MTFHQLRLAEPILRAVAAEGYTIPTPIQLKAIPHVLEGRDLLGCAQTGTGKTAAFALPILHRLFQHNGRAAGRVRPIRVLVLAPTRELASQINESFRAYGRHTALRSAVIFGGVSQRPQTDALGAGVDILVATPGRLLDLMEQGYVDLRNVEVFVLDEADNMLDMGFIHDIRKIIPKLPRQRQTLLFSATMPEEIRELAGKILDRAVSVAVTPVASTVETVEQSVYMVDKPFKPALLSHFLNHNATGRVLVFTRTKHGADRLARHLNPGGIVAEAIHGNKSQNARNRVMAKFKSSAPPILIATDIAARGLDIDDVTHVINYDLPNVPETYVHRIGRTARAGATGVAVSFCDHEERPLLEAVERLTRRPVPVRKDQPKFTAADLPPRPPRNEALRHEHRSGAPRRDGREAGGRRGNGHRDQGHRQSHAPAPSRQSTSGGQVELAESSSATAVAAPSAAPSGVGYRGRGVRRGGRSRRR